MSEPRLPIAPGQPVIERRMGCYNCIHSAPETAKEFWKTRRQQDLAHATQQALADPQGEKAPQVMQAKRMIDAVDKAIAAGLLTKCRVGGSSADLTSLGYLCDKWTARDGASVARDGKSVDKLPEELMDDLQSGELTKRKIT